MPSVWGVSLQRPLPGLTTVPPQFPLSSARPLLPRALTASTGNLSFLRAGGAGSSRVSSARAGSADGRARLRLPPLIGAGALGSSLAGLGVLQVRLAHDDAARGLGRRRAKKSVTRHCAIARRKTRTQAAAGAELQTEVVPRFAPIFAPHEAPPPTAPPPTAQPLAQGRGWKGRDMDAPTRVRASCALRLCHSAAFLVVVGYLRPLCSVPPWDLRW